MRKSLLAIFTIALFSTKSFAQQEKPLINSGEIIEQAVKLHDEGKYKEAVELYKKINRSDTNYVRALYECSLSYSADSQFNDAIAMCRLAIAEKTDLERMPDLLTQYGSLLDNIGSPEKSIQLFDSALNVYPTHSLLYLNKGTTLMGMKRNAEAASVFQQAILQDPYAASCHYKLGVINLQAGKLVPSFFCFMNYLLVLPGGRYSNNCIAYLNAIAKNTDLVTGYTETRKEECPEEYSLVEKIIQSKIALDKNYKPIIDLDDPISRQIQVLLEKINYEAGSNDFCMQYYVPYYKNVFSSGKFEALINYIFSQVNVTKIQEYNKKNKKEIQALTSGATDYFNRIRVTRQLNYAKRADAENNYYYENGKVAGKGSLAQKTGKLTGEWIFYYPSGNIKSSGKYNDIGEREGAWKYYFMDGSLKATQFFTGEKLDGNEKYYFQNGVLSSDDNYKADKQEAESSSYYYAGPRRMLAHYAGGKLEGNRCQFFSNGNIKSTENFVSDKLNGSFTTFFKNGIHESEGNYINGDLDGVYKAWFDNGQLSIEGTYAKDKETGTWKKYHSNGKLKSIGHFVNGKEEGDYEEYYSNGQLFTKYTYKKGIISGVVTYNDDDGKPFSTYIFEDGRTVSARYLDKDGKETGKSELKDGKINIVSFFPDGTKKSETTYDKKGNAEGVEKIFYHNGTTSQTNTYIAGQLEGNSTSYYLNGQKSSRLQYAGGKKDGYYTSYYFNGVLQTEGWYKDNRAQGIWINYDELGNLVSRTYFLNDELEGHKEEFYLNGQKEFDTKYHFGWIEEMKQYDTLGNILHTVTMNKGRGRFAARHLNKKIKFEGDYVNGDFDGPHQSYFFDGTVQVSQYYKKGELDSICRTYYYGGKVNTEGLFQNGKKVGTWKYYRKTGKLSNTEVYVNGVLNGHSTSYYEGGEIDLDIAYTDGERDGDTKKYEPGGNLVYQIKYKSGLPISYTYSDRQGKLMPDILFTGGSGKLRTFYPNGQLATDHVYSEGKVNGPYKLYFPDGKPWIEREDSYDITNGELKQYHANGQLKASYGFLNDNNHGPYKEYNSKGVLTEEGSFYNGTCHGDVKLYNDDGKLIETDIYYYGTLLGIKK